MKYRAGHGEERFSERSVEYCRRARAHLASLGAPLANSPPPSVRAFAAFRLYGATRSTERGGTSTLRGGDEFDAIGRAKSRQVWAAHDARMKVITGKVTSAWLRIAAGI